MLATIVMLTLLTTACSAEDEGKTMGSAMKKAIHTNKAPSAIGTYSQAVEAGGFLFISGQIPMSPDGNLVDSSKFDTKVKRVFENLKAIATEAGADLNQSVKITIYLTDLSNFATVNSVMAEYFDEPYPARVTVEVHKLPRGAEIEIDAILKA